MYVAMFPLLPHNYATYKFYIATCQVIEVSLCCVSPLTKLQVNNITLYVLFMIVYILF